MPGAVETRPEFLYTGGAARRRAWIDRIRSGTSRTGQNMPKALSYGGSRMDEEQLRLRKLYARRHLGW